MKLAVVGSTSFKSESGLEVAADLIFRVIQKHRPDCIVSGGAKGVDSVAREVALSLGYEHVEPHERLDRMGTFCEYLPRVQRWEGYRERNLVIAQDCTHLLAIRCAHSRTYGSGWTADRAEEMGRQVHRHIVASL